MKHSILALVASLLVACSCSTAKPAVPDKLETTVVVDTRKAVRPLEVSFDPDSRFKVARLTFDRNINEAEADQLAYLIAAAGPAGLDGLVIELRTNGGEVPAGERIAKAIEASPVPIICVVDTRALSMGFYVLQSCPVRLMTKRAVLMAHDPSRGAGGDKGDLRDAAVGLSAVAEALAEHLCARLKLEQKDCRSQFDGKEWWLGYKEALAAGAVDGIVPTGNFLLKKMQTEGAIPLIE